MHELILRHQEITALLAKKINNSTEKDGDRVHGVHGRVAQSNKREQTVPQFEESVSYKLILKGSSTYWWPIN